VLPGEQRTAKAACYTDEPAWAKRGPDELAGRAPGKCKSSVADGNRGK
jgi:hypothetical protein